MKSVFLIPLLFLTVLAFGQKPTLKMKYSEQLTVFVFIQNLSENHPENVFKTAFQKSKYNTENYRNKISEFDKLSIDYSYQFEEFPYGSKAPMQTRDILKKNLIETDNLNDFRLRSIGLVPIKTLNDLAALILYFTPIYNELIYTPNKEKFEKQVIEITDYANDHHIEGFFQTGLSFYHSVWDQSIPFQIAFYPLPDSDYFTAQAFCNNFVSAIQTNLKDYKDLLSVMMHEIFHIIYNEQSLEMKIKIDKDFKENKSKYSNYAYQLLNELLATALGNGYVYEQLEGELDQNDWYYHQYIDLMARKIYPVVKNYITEKKSIDKNFIDTYINLYETNFPNWINESDNIMTYRYVISEDEKDFNTINQLFRYRSSAEYENEITERSIEKMQKTPLTKIIIVSNKNLEKLRLIKSKFKELTNWKFTSDQDFTYKILLADKSQLIIINTVKKDLKKLIQSIK
ncbi:hypothetical protein [Chryseobacterium sp. GP-SGM7]|uniref:hypothetical protein n=1 Tax=Chryseobacterium sp. GP-SGM7 TaxID=3411323 RepID=UPI003B923CDE